MSTFKANERRHLKALCAFSILLVVSLFFVSVNAQTPWRGKKCAVVLTYDDGYHEQLDHALPTLDSLGLKATFYLSAYFPAVKNRMDDWRKVAASGHELGNHTLYHPCIGNIPGREWVNPENDLSTYSVQRIVDEVRMTNVFLKALDGKDERTFAYTCGDMTIGDSSFIVPLKNDFVAVRAVRHEMHQLNEIDLYSVDSYVVNGQTAEEMVAWVKQAMETNSLLVILFHGVGGGNALDVAKEEHDRLLHFIKENEKDIWVAPMVEVANYVKFMQDREQAQRETQEDYEDMLGQLGNPALRPGPSGNPSAPNAANTDESKASPYKSLPDPLTLKDGEKVKDAKTWWNKRRDEILEDFDREVYGRTPSNTPKVTWELVRTVDTTIGDMQAVTKYLIGRVDNSSYPQITVDIQLSLTTPKHTDRPVPVIMEFGFILPRGFNLPPPTGKSWQEQVLESGYGYAILVPTSYQADNGAGLTEGIIGLVNSGQRRKPDDWGALKAWAWGASRAIDYFETDKSVDATKVAIEGLSRYGKAAIVAMAYEPRIAVGFIGSSGAGGTKILRRVLGEQVENLASSAEYHWFAGNFINYAGPLTPDDLPVDAHELVALCAPRPVFISSGSPTVEGQWVDARGMFLGGVHAGPVYKLLGKKDLGTTEFPPIETALTGGDIAWRQHSGGHTTVPNWPTFLEWVERYFNQLQN